MCHVHVFNFFFFKYYFYDRNYNYIALKRHSHHIAHKRKPSIIMKKERKKEYMNQLATVGEYI